LDLVVYQLKLVHVGVDVKLAAKPDMMRNESYRRVGLLATHHEAFLGFT
jgi:hypothetical protein